MGDPRYARSASRLISASQSSWKIRVRAPSLTMIPSFVRQRCISLSLYDEILRRSRSLAREGMRDHRAEKDDVARRGGRFRRADQHCHVAARHHHELVGAMRMRLVVAESF